MLIHAWLACTQPDATGGGPTPDGWTTETGPLPNPTTDTTTGTPPTGTTDDGDGDDDDDDDGEFLFSETVHVFALEIPDASWNELEGDLWGGGDYVGAYLTTPELDVIEVGIKLTGQSSFQGINDKPSFKIKVDFFDELQRYDGLKKFNLHNLTWDGSFTAEYLSYRIWREFGLPAPRVSHGELTVNGELYGLYSLVENVDGQMLDEHFDDDNGNLYEGAGCDLDWCDCLEVDIDDEGTHAALGELCDAATEEGDAWNTAIHDAMNWDHFVGHIAMEAWISHWDGYSWNNNNFRLYHEPTLDQFSFIPWSTDLSFGWAGPRTPGDPPSCHTYATDISTYTLGILNQSCYDDLECQADYADKMLAISDLVETLPYETWIDEAVARLDPYVQADTKRSYTIQDFYDQNECFKDFLRERPQEIRDAVPGL